MIIYGSKASHQKTERFAGQCPNCAAQNSVNISVFQKYAHVFWIPLFPIGKAGGSECSNCKQVLEVKNMPESLKLAFQNVKSQTKLPIWTFTGLALFAGLIVYSSIQGQKNKEENQAFIKAPKKGDVYEYKTKEKQYTLLKVTQVNGDTVYISQNQFEVNKSKGLSKIREKGDAAFSQESFPILKSEINTMFESGDIIDVDRKE